MADMNPTGSTVDRRETPELISQSTTDSWIPSGGDENALVNQESGAVLRRNPSDPVEAQQRSVATCECACYQIFH